MVETPEERKKRLNREAARRYRARLAKKADTGDKKAIAQTNKNNKNKMYSTCKSFIALYANKTELSEMRELIAQRVLQLNHQKNK